MKQLPCGCVEDDFGQVMYVVPRGALNALDLENLYDRPGKLIRVDGDIWKCAKDHTSPAPEDDE